MFEKKLKVGTRGSELALIQKETIVNILLLQNPGTIFETVGDKIRTVPISHVLFYNQIGTQGVFSEELAVALLTGQLDIVVHSLKDLTTKISPDTLICCIPKREQPFDVAVLSSKYNSLADIRSGGVVGTSSPRRVAQLKKLYPHLERGNIGTRIKKLNNEQYDAIILAYAGLKRCNFSDLRTEGALAVQCRANDIESIKACLSTIDIETALICACEREILKTLNGGCCVPIGVEAYIKDNYIHIKCGIFSLDGLLSIIDYDKAEIHQPESSNVENFCVVSDIVFPKFCEKSAQACVDLGRKLASRMLVNGGDRIMKNISHICNTKPIERIVSLDK